MPPISGPTCVYDKGIPEGEYDKSDSYSPKKDSTHTKGSQLKSEKPQIMHPHESHKQTLLTAHLVRIAQKQKSAPSMPQNSGKMTSKIDKVTP